MLRGGRKMTISLYQLIPAYQGVMEAIESADQEEMQCLVDTLESINASLEVKAEGYCKMVAMLDRHADAMEAERDRMASLMLSVRNKSKYMKERLQNGMEAMGKDEVRTEIFTIRIKNNPPAVDVHDPDKIPADFKRTTVTVAIDKAKIKAAIQSGQE